VHYVQGTNCYERKETIVWSMAIIFHLL